VRLGSFDVKERNEDANLEHVHELFVESFTYHIMKRKRLIVKNFDLVLLDKK